ncbi:MAG: diguanylate cyclase [Rhodospirillales bacterium]|nr:diguanylate cyclase [Rhodospirillales bacterium]
MSAIDDRTPPADGGDAAGNAKWLDGYPGGALLVTPEGTVIAANRAGREFASILLQGEPPPLTALIQRAMAGGSIVAEMMELPVNEGQVVLDLTVMPRARGDALLVLLRDVTMEHNLRPALIESRQRYKDLVEVSSDFAWEVGPDGAFVFVSSQSALGYAADELIGQRPAELVVDAAAYRPFPFQSDQPLDGVELWMRRSDDTLACVAVSCRPLHAADGTWLGARGVCRDITREREREAALMRARHREQILHYVIQAIRNEVEPENMLTAAAASAARALGASGCRVFRMAAPGAYTLAAEFGETEGLPSADMEAILADIDDADITLEREIGPWRVLGAVTDYRAAVNGGVCLCKAGGLTDWSDDERLLVGDIADQLGIAIEQINNHERIVRLSRTDALTGLLNRRAFYDDEMPRRLRRLEHARTSAALYYVDLDNFKAVNDRHGHQHGDEALVAVRDLLLEHSRPGDMIARIGGDEFVMWLDGIGTEVAEVRARRLIEASLRLHRFSQGVENPLGISVGVAVYDPAAKETLDELLARADVAMYSVKRRGKGGFEMAEPPTRRG